MSDWNETRGEEVVLVQTLANPRTINIANSVQLHCTPIPVRVYIIVPCTVRKQGEGYTRLAVCCCSLCRLAAQYVYLPCARNYYVYQVIIFDQSVEYTADSSTYIGGPRKAQFKKKMLRNKIRLSSNANWYAR